MNNHASEPLITSREEGFSMIEALISILLIAIMSAGIFASMRTSLRTTKLVEFNHIATSLATSKMEELTSISVNTLDATYSGVEPDVGFPEFGATFTRETTVTVNPDDSRRVVIVVSSNNPNIPTRVEFTNTLALWE